MRKGRGTQQFRTLPLFGAIRISLFSGSSVVSNSEVGGRVSLLIRQRSLLRKASDRAADE